MSRNEIFLLLACVFAVAIMSGPLPQKRGPDPVALSFASVAPISDPTLWQHSFDHQ